MAKKQVAVSLRKPPSPEKADAFVSGGAAQKGEPQAKTKPETERAPEAARVESSAAVEAPVAASAAVEASSGEPLAGASSEPQLGVPVLVGADGRTRRAVTIYLPAPLAERLLLHCIEQDRDMSNVVGEALDDHLKKLLGPGLDVASDGPAPRRVPPAAAASSGGAFHVDPFRGAEGGGSQGRIDRFLQVGRVLIALWQQRPWSA